MEHRKYEDERKRARSGCLAPATGPNGAARLLGVVAAKMIPHFPPPAVPWWAIVGATGFSALVGMLFGILPARRAANLTPIDALRHE